MARARLRNRFSSARTLRAHLYCLPPPPLPLPTAFGVLDVRIFEKQIYFQARPINWNWLTHRHRLLTVDSAAVVSISIFREKLWDGRGGGWGLCLYVHILEFYNRCVASLTVEWRRWGAWNADRFLFFTFQPDFAITSNEVKSPVATRAKTETKAETKAATKGQGQAVAGEMGPEKRLENIQINFRTSPVGHKFLLTRLLSPYFACSPPLPTFLILTYGLPYSVSSSA